MSTRLQVGDWKVNINPCSPGIEDLLNEVVNVFSTKNWDDSKSDAVHLAVCTPELVGRSEIPNWLLESEYTAWHDFLNALKSALPHIRRGDPLGSPIFCWPPLRPNKTEKTTSFPPNGDCHFFAFVMDKLDEHCRVELMLHILFLANKWHVERGGLGVHASAVANGEKGFLFLGPSEAGKSTVARLSLLRGHSPLGDDINFIISDENNGYKLASGPTLSKPNPKHSLHRPVLRGIFSLMQDERDFLVPLPPLKVAQQLIKSLGQVPFYGGLSKQNLTRSFQTCCAIAKQIPGYELHFRKSPDFWKLIDERFPS